MRAQKVSIPQENLEVLKNMDFWSRSGGRNCLLFGSDYHGEGHCRVALELAELTQVIYRRSVVMVDLCYEEPANIPSTIQYQNIKDLKWLMNGAILNERKLDSHLKVLREQNSLVFLILDVKRNPESTKLPEAGVDGAVLIRSSRSVGLSKKRFVTNMIKDANLPILGLVYNRN